MLCRNMRMAAPNPRARGTRGLSRSAID